MKLMGHRTSLSRVYMGEASPPPPGCESSHVQSDCWWAETCRFPKDNLLPGDHCFQQCIIISDVDPQLNSFLQNAAFRSQDKVKNIFAVFAGKILYWNQSSVSGASSWCYHTHMLFLYYLKIFISLSLCCWVARFDQICLIIFFCLNLSRDFKKKYITALIVIYYYIIIQRLCQIYILFPLDLWAKQQQPNRAILSTIFSCPDQKTQSHFMTSSKCNVCW